MKKILKSQISFSFFLFTMEDGLYRKRHSLSHILAQAIQREQQRDVEVAIGPAIDNGFYYDFDFLTSIGREEFTG